MDRHYAYSICGPARASLLSGRLAPHVLVKKVAVTARNEEDPVSGYWFLVKEFTVSYHKKETILFALDPIYGNLN